MGTLKEIKADYEYFQNNSPKYLDWVIDTTVKGILTYSLDELEKV